jgi:hypothetical protein
MFRKAKSLTYKVFLRQASLLTPTKCLSLYVINISPSLLSTLLFFTSLKKKIPDHRLRDQCLCRVRLLTDWWITTKSWNALITPLRINWRERTILRRHSKTNPLCMLLTHSWKHKTIKGKYVALPVIVQHISCPKIFFFHGVTAPGGSGPPHYRGFTIILRHTILDRTRLDEWSVRRGDLYLTTHNTHKRQISMPPVGFEPAIPASEWPQIHTLVRTAIGIGQTKLLSINIKTDLNISKILDHTKNQYPIKNIGHVMCFIYLLTFVYTV